MKKFLSLVLAVSMALGVCAFANAFAEETPEITWLMSGTGTTADENNLVLQEIEKRVGVRVKPIQTAPGDFEARLNTMIASRTLPDLFSIGISDAKEFISEGMLLAAVDAIAGLIAPGDRSACNIIPDPFDPRVVPAVAAAVAERARKEGLARA